MAGFTLSKQINASPETVFALFTDLANAPGRIRAITKLEVLTPGPVGAGTRFRETRMMFGRQCTEEMQISAFDPGRGYTVACHSCGAEFRNSFRFTGNCHGTGVEVEMETRARSLVARLMKPLAWLMMRSMKKCIDQDLEDLRRAAESSAPPGAGA